MGQVIAMPDNQCEEVCLLLPWHVAGTLEASDQALVERHLAHCERCCAALALERKFVIGYRVSSDGDTVDSGWQALISQLDVTGSRTETTIPVLPPRSARRDRRRWAMPLRVPSKPSTLRWVIGCQFAALLALGSIIALPHEREGAYRALGDASVDRAREGNTLAMFRPDLSEALLRRALTRSGARVVDGPTAAGAYVLNVPGGAIGSQLVTLRAQAGVTMAEPIGEGTTE